MKTLTLDQNSLVEQEQDFQSLIFSTYNVLKEDIENGIFFWSIDYSTKSIEIRSSDFEEVLARVFSLDNGKTFQTMLPKFYKNKKNLWKRDLFPDEVYTNIFDAMIAVEEYLIGVIVEGEE